MTATKYRVWRRNDGYISATAYNVSTREFEILLVTEDWTEARDLIASERKAAGHPENGWLWTCQMADCENDAKPRPVYDANPNPAARKQIGTTSICTPCQTAIDNLNAKVTR
jgi:hypothetical protein